MLNIESLLYKAESDALDFKQENYKFVKATDDEKGELLKDILAFANSWRTEVAHILIGVKEVKGAKSEIIGINEELDDSRLQQFVNGKTQRRLEFHYQTLVVEDKKIGVIRIPIQERPIYLKENFGKLIKNEVYIRRGSSTATALPDEIRDMGKELATSLSIPNLIFEFADSGENSLGEKNFIIFKSIDIEDNIEDYTENDSLLKSSLGFQRIIVNQNYYRDLIEYWSKNEETKKINFLLRNDSNVTVSGITLELIVENSDSFYFIKKRSFPDFPQKHKSNIPKFNSPFITNVAIQTKSIDIGNIGNNYRIEIHFDKIKPKQTMISPDMYLIIDDNCEIKLNVKIYAENIPIPIEKTLEISCITEKRINSFEQFKNQYNIV